MCPRVLTGRPLHVALPADQYGARVVSDTSKQTISDAEGKEEVQASWRSGLISSIPSLFSANKQLAQAPFARRWYAGQGPYFETSAPGLETKLEESRGACH